MRLTRVGLAAVLATLPSVALSRVGTSVAAQAATTASLAGVTTITASHSGYVDVTLQSTVLLSPKPLHNPDVSLTGAGRFVGFSLYRPDGSGLIAYRLPAFDGGQLQVWGDGDFHEKCTSIPSNDLPLQKQCSYSAPTHYILRPGHYRLLVITDGSPLSITLRLPGLAGRTTVRPAHPLRVVEAALPTRETVGTNTVSFGAWRHMPNLGAGLVLATAADPGGATVDGAEMCMREDAQPNTPLAFAPGCSYGNTTGGGFYTFTVAGLRVGTGGASVGSGLGPEVGLGGSFTNSTGVKLLGALGVWVDRFPI